MAEQQPLSMKKSMGYGHEKKKLCIFFFFFVLGSVSLRASLTLLKSLIIESEGEIVGFLSSLDHVPLFFGLGCALRPTRVGDVH